MELGSWGSRKEVVLGQGPLTPLPVCPAPQMSW